MSSLTIVTVNIEDLFLWKVSTEVWDYVKSLHVGIYVFAYVDNLYKPELYMAWTQRKHFQNFQIHPTELNNTVSILQNIFCVSFVWKAIWICKLQKFLAEITRNIVLARKGIDGPGYEEKGSCSCTILRLHF